MAGYFRGLCDLDQSAGRLVATLTKRLVPVHLCTQRGTGWSDPQHSVHAQHLDDTPTTQGPGPHDPVSPFPTDPVLTPKVHIDPSFSLFPFSFFLFPFLVQMPPCLSQLGASVNRLLGFSTCDWMHHGFSAPRPCQAPR